MSTPPSSAELLTLAAKIVSAHVGHNSVPAEAMPGLIRSVYSALSGVGIDAPAEPPLQPAVPVKKSVFPDFIVCLEDGIQLKMLKRHLKTRYDLTPAQYRARWGLAREYPMVAPSYASRRSALAKSIGLGRKPAARDEQPAPAVTRLPEKARGRRGSRRPVA